LFCGERKKHNGETRCEDGKGLLLQIEASPLSRYGEGEKGTGEYGRVKNTAILQGERGGPVEARKFRAVKVVNREALRVVEGGLRGREGGNSLSGENVI